MTILNVSARLKKLLALSKVMCSLWLLSLSLLWAQPSLGGSTSDLVELIKRYEGYSATAYQCQGGVWTVGWGSTRDVHEGLVVTLAEANRRLGLDLDRARRRVATLVVVPLTSYQRDALTSLVFNIGVGNLRSSTLLAKLNKGDYAGAQAEFKRWRKSGGVVLPGLVARRAEEATMFGGPHGRLLFYGRES